jgi:type I restriction enzyme S subunit
MAVQIPSISYQEKIVKILLEVNGDIEKTVEVMKKAIELKKGLMQELFIKGIGHKKFKKTKLGIIPEEWDIEKLINIATLQRGFDLPAKNRIQGVYPLATSNGITDTHNEFRVKGPGVFTGRSGTIGRIFYVNKDYWPLNTVLYVKDFHGNDEKFIYYFLQTIGLKKHQTGTGVPTLNRNVVHCIEFAVPKIKEQGKIANILSELDKKIEICIENKSKLLKLKKGLIQDLLSNK